MFNRDNLFSSRESRQPPAGYHTPRYSPAPSNGSYSDLPRPDPRLGAQPSHPARTPVMSSRSPRPAAGGQGWSLRPTKSPDSSYTYGNLVAVSPLDIPPSRDGTDLLIIVNDQSVFTARPLNGFPAGMIGMSDPQRTWAQVSLTDVVNVKPYDVFANGGEAYVASMDVEVGFAGKKRTDAPYDQDELAAAVIHNFQNQILAPGQKILMDYKSIPLLLTVKTVQLGSLNEKGSKGSTSSVPTTRGILTPLSFITFFKDARTDINLKASTRRSAPHAIIQPDFKFENMGIGGLDEEFSTIFRRAFASRLFPPAIVERLGITHVKGVLLFGPPGTGKTLIARQIGKMLNTRPPKVINGPEVLNKYVGQSEENVRKLFADAEKEYKEKGDESGLHIIIFDELDAVCRQRGSGSGGGTGVGDNVVNQLLSKLDGVDQLNNLLLIGMTNRMDMIDEALLRPGRLELHVEISLPDEAGRVQILKIHTAKMKTNNHLGDDVDLNELAAKTKNFSGAEIAGLVRAAASFAFSRHIKIGDDANVSEDAINLKVTRDDFMHALETMEPAYGVPTENLETCMANGIIHFSPHVDRVLKLGMLQVKIAATPKPSGNVFSLLLHGERGAGKTALSAKIALDSGLPFVRMITPHDMMGFNDMMKVSHIQKVMQDAHKSVSSIIILDSIEQLIEWSDIGPRFSNTVVHAIQNLVTKPPPKGRQLLVIATSSERTVLEKLKVYESFDEKVHVAIVNTYDELAHILRQVKSFPDQDIDRALSGIKDVTQSKRIGVGIKQVLRAIQAAHEDDDLVEGFVNAMTRRMEESGSLTDNFA